jgi:hypothetical protein
VALPSIVPKIDGLSTDKTIDLSLEKIGLPEDFDASLAVFKRLLIYNLTRFPSRNAAETLTELE